MGNSIAVWSGDIENALVKRVIDSVAPGEGIIEEAAVLREASSSEELAAVAENYARAASHDAFIVQAVSRAIATLDIDSRFHLKLAEQVGDDGRHAVQSIQVADKITGTDSFPLVDSYVEEFWEVLADVPYRDVFGFIAFQFHFELHLIGRIVAQNRHRKIRFDKKAALGQVAEPTSSANEADDELVHRTYVAEWTRAQLIKVPAAERSEWMGKLIAADEDVQRRLNPYHRYRIGLAERAWQSDVSRSVPIYDTFRRECLAYVLDIGVDQLPSLTSLAA
jgi:hypothetical protein